MEQKVSDYSHIWRRRGDVWRVFTDSGSWDRWFGVALERVDPGWQAGATLVWTEGEPSRIESCMEAESLVVRAASGTVTTWRFTVNEAGSTDVSCTDDFSASSPGLEDPHRHMSRVHERLSNLIRLVEESVPVVPDPAEPEASRRGEVSQQLLLEGHLRWIRETPAPIAVVRTPSLESARRLAFERLRTLPVYKPPLVVGVARIEPPGTLQYADVECVRWGDFPLERTRPLLLFAAAPDVELIAHVFHDVWRSVRVIDGREAPPHRVDGRASDPASLDVPELSRVRWPDRCMVCGAPGPTKAFDPGVSFTSGRTAWRRSGMRVPLCPSDRWRVVWRLALFRGLPPAFWLGSPVVVAFAWWGFSRMRDDDNVAASLPVALFAWDSRPGGFLSSWRESRARILARPGRIYVRNDEARASLEEVLGTVFPREAAAAAQPAPELTVGEAAERLAAIYAARPEGFVLNMGGPYVAEIRRIGKALDAAGGMEKMRETHARFSSLCGIRGAARNLEMVWDGVGRWQG